MSKIVNNYYILYNNPFLLSDVIIEFYKNYETKQSRELLLSYLVFPFTLYEVSIEALQRANGKRSIRSFIKSTDRLYGLQSRIQEFKDLTNQCLQFAIDQGLIVIKQDLTIEITELGQSVGKNDTIKKHLLASANLAKMFSGVELVSVFRQLGIKEI